MNMRRVTLILFTRKICSLSVKIDSWRLYLSNISLRSSWSSPQTLLHTLWHQSRGPFCCLNVVVGLIPLSITCVNWFSSRSCVVSVVSLCVSSSWLICSVQLYVFTWYFLRTWLLIWLHWDRFYLPLLSTYVYYFLSCSICLKLVFSWSTWSWLCQLATLLFLLFHSSWLVLLMVYKYVLFIWFLKLLD